MPQTLLAIEPVFADFQHAPVNAGHLQALALAFPRDRIVFAAHPGHRAAVFDSLEPQWRSRFTERDIAVAAPGGLSFGRFRAQAEAICGMIRAEEPTTLLCLAATPETMFALRLAVALWRRLRVVVVLHGMLFNTVGWRSRDPRRRLFDDRSALRAADHPRIRLVSLERIIRSRGVELGLLDPARCDVWPHVINDAELWDAPHRPDPRRLRIGFLGFATDDKGFPAFLEAARLVRGTPGSPVEFRAIGGLADHAAPDAGTITSTGRGLSRPDFLAEIRALDFAFLALDDRRYTLTPSGSAVDCIAALKPFLALDGVSVRNYAAQPSAGFIARDARELARVLADPRALTESGRYGGWQDALRSLRTDRSPQALASLVGASLTIPA